MKLRISPSMLSTFARCKLKAFLRALGYRGVVTREEEGANAPLEAGKAVHRALWAKLAGKSDDEAIAELDAYRMFADSKLPVDDRLGYLNVRRVTVAYFHQRKLDHLNFMAMFPEREFIVPLDDAGEIELIGRFDVAVVKMVSTGALWIMEHKTTGRYLVGKAGDDWFRQWRTDGQVSAQVYAARKLGINAVGVLLNAIGMHKLPGSNKKCNEHQLPYSECGEAHLQARMQPEQRDEGQIENWRKNAIEIALELKAMLLAGKTEPLEAAQLMRQEGLFNGSCAYCEFARFCGTGRQNSAWLEKDTNPEGVTRSGLYSDG